MHVSCNYQTTLNNNQQGPNTDRTVPPIHSAEHRPNACTSYTWLILWLSLRRDRRTDGQLSGNGGDVTARTTIVHLRFLELYTGDDEAGSDLDVGLRKLRLPWLLASHLVLCDCCSCEVWLMMQSVHVRYGGVHVRPHCGLGFNWYSVLSVSFWLCHCLFNSNGVNCWDYVMTLRSMLQFSLPILLHFPHWSSSESQKPKTNKYGRTTQMIWKTANHHQKSHHERNRPPPGTNRR